MAYNIVQVDIGSLITSLGNRMAFLTSHSLQCRLEGYRAINRDQITGAALQNIAAIQDLGYFLWVN